jgi:hypothetical protein
MTLTSETLLGGVHHSHEPQTGIVPEYLRARRTHIALDLANGTAWATGLMMPEAQREPGLRLLALMLKAIVSAGSKLVMIMFQNKLIMTGQN